MKLMTNATTMQTPMTMGERTPPMKREATIRMKRKPSARFCCRLVSV